MAKLTTGARAKLATSKFADPEKGKYPIEDKAHAANAKARVAGQENKGAVSPGYKAMVDAKANKVLGKGASDPDEANEDPAEEAAETPAQEAAEEKLEPAEKPAKAAAKKPAMPMKKPPFMSASMTGVRANKRNKATVI